VQGHDPFPSGISSFEIYESNAHVLVQRILSPVGLSLYSINCILSEGTT